jgi:chromosome segregation protein
MTALLTRLRIAGFKSFAEPASLDILPGLTGIVGPNGCGKSNVVEALRWAMGETSVRSLRGGEMDDVIFAGTSARASRNLAEVTITLARGDATLPDPFGAEEELQVTRRIERGAGSAYKANGREMRARDVQTLFADMASGAHSTAMVSQGRVSALVNAKPENRRQVLEEAAGITGLHARRHEAELKLRAAEANLSKSEDLRAQLDAARDALRKQARQATRYRNISGLVRTAETEFLAIQHARATVALAAARQAQARAEADVAVADAARQQAAAAVAAAEAALPEPRMVEAGARSALERKRLEAEMLAADAQRATRAHQDAAHRLAQIESDLDDATRLEADAVAAAAQLQAEADALAAQLSALPARAEAAAAAMDLARADLDQAEEHADAASTLAAEATAALRQATLAEAAAGQRLADAEQALSEARAARDTAEAALVDPAQIAAAQAACIQAGAAAHAARQAVEDAETARAAAAAAAAQATASLQRAESLDQAARARQAEAQARHVRIQSALDQLDADIARAESARLAPAVLAGARHDAVQAQDAAEAGEQAVRNAEAAHGAAGGARLALCRQRDALLADHARLAEAHAAAAARRARLEQETAELTQAMTAARAGCVKLADLDAAREAARAAGAHAGDADAATRAASQARAVAEAALAEARLRATRAAADAARLQAEADGLAHALASHDDDDTTLLDELSVPPGLEAAIGAALAHAAASLDETRPSFWRSLPPLAPPGLPGGAQPLSGCLHAPPALSRLLSHTGLLPEGADGAAGQAQLAAGTALVSRDGAVWRWDGQVISAGAPNAAATRLRQRARLAELRADIDAATGLAATLADAARTAEADAAAAASDEAAARQLHAEASARLAEAQQALAAIAAEAERAETRVQALAPALARVHGELEAACAAEAAAGTARAALPDGDSAAAAAAAAEAAASAAAAALEQARTDRDAARLASLHAAAILKAVEGQAAEAESIVASLRPQRPRLADDLACVVAQLSELAADIAALPDLPDLRARTQAAGAALNAAAGALDAARERQQQAVAGQRDAAAVLAALERAHAEAGHALAARDTVLASAEAEYQRAAAGLSAARADIGRLPDAADLAASAAAARAALAACRAAHAEAAQTYSDIVQATGAARHRAPALAQELLAWQGRAEESARRRFGLATRHAAEAAEVAALAEAPPRLAERAAASGDALAAAESAHVAAAALLREAEYAVRSATQAQREADAAFATCRETLARGEGTLETAAAALAGVLANAAERLGAEAALPGAPEADEAAEERARRKLERLQRERDEMGPVNLRADIELEEITSRIEAIDHDRDELTTAIAKLRGSIGHLNREGRERLTAVFTQVDTHFRTLFTRMMGGGRAHLALTGSDDPLTAGLEIYAEPPGKKLSTLSLLSGGEQALTALSLIFAVFRCTPAPIAVLDEVDAPLDDANVDRFCSLLEDVVRDTGTRFLVVTHHQLTMSRMDRLYGVTMQERGVSRLLSVDLRRATELAEPALQAAE